MVGNIGASILWREARSICLGRRHHSSYWLRAVVLWGSTVQHQYSRPKLVPLWGIQSGIFGVIIEVLEQIAVCVFMWYAYEMVHAA